MLLIWILFWFYLNFFTKYNRSYFLISYEILISLWFKPMVSPTFMAPRDIEEDNFSMDQAQGGWFQDDYIFLYTSTK